MGEVYLHRNPKWASLSSETGRFFHLLPRESTSPEKCTIQDSPQNKKFHLQCKTQVREIPNFLLIVFLTPIHKKYLHSHPFLFSPVLEVRVFIRKKRVKKTVEITPEEEAKAEPLNQKVRNPCLFVSPLNFYVVFENPCPSLIIRSFCSIFVSQKSLICKLYKI